jgi:hypothetical protein
VDSEFQVPIAMSGKDGACVIYENHVARVDLLKTPPGSLHPKQR